MDSKLIGSRIEARRQSLGLTMDHVASEIGVAKSTIQRYEKGTIEKMKLPVIEAIARVLNVSPAWLCGKAEFEASLPVCTLTAQEQQLISLSRQLNEEGQEKLLDYADDLVTSGKYIKNNPNPVGKEA